MLKKFLAFTKIVGAESENLSFGAEGVPFTVEQEHLAKKYESYKWVERWHALKEEIIIFGER